jgi:hypothetical protein
MSATGQQVTSDPAATGNADGVATPRRAPEGQPRHRRRNLIAASAVIMAAAGAVAVTDPLRGSSPPAAPGPHRRAGLKRMHERLAEMSGGADSQTARGAAWRTVRDRGGS